MTVKDILEKVTHACCGALGLGDDDDGGKPLPIYGKPNKAKVSSSSDDVKQEQAPPAKKSAPKFTGKGKDTKYEEVMWDNLPKEAKEAATVLGFDKESWDTNAWLDIQDYWWEDMSEEQVAAATALGWDKVSWDSKYEDADWADLPAPVQKAAESLGFTQEMWDDDSWPEGLWDKDYVELTADEASALAVLGYNKIDWDEA